MVHTCSREVKVGKESSAGKGWSPYKVPVERELGRSVGGSGGHCVGLPMIRQRYVHGMNHG